MAFRWIEKEVVLAVHDRQIAEHGGAGGVRDLDLIESAIDRPKNLFAYGSADVYDLAAAYGYGLARNHAFVDSNKRTAYVVTRLFLRLNGHDLSAPPVQRVLIFERLGRGDLTQEDLAAWLRKHGTRLRSNWGTSIKK